MKKKSTVLALTFVSMCFYGAQEPTLKSTLSPAERVNQFEREHPELKADIKKFIDKWTAELGRTPTDSDRQKLKGVLQTRYKDELKKLDDRARDTLLRRYTAQAAPMEERMGKLPPKSKLQENILGTALQAAMPFWRKSEKPLLASSEGNIHSVRVSGDGSIIIIHRGQDIELAERRHGIWDISQFVSGDILDSATNNNGSIIAWVDRENLLNIFSGSPEVFSIGNVIAGRTTNCLTSNSAGTHFAVMAEHGIMVASREGESWGLRNAIHVPNGLEGCAMSDNGQVVLAITERGNLGAVLFRDGVWKFKDEPVISNVSLVRRPLAINADGTRIAVANKDEGISILQLRKVLNKGLPEEEVWVKLPKIRGIKDFKVNNLLMSADGSIIVAQIMSSGDICIITQDGTKVQVLSMSAGSPLRDIAMSKNGEIIAADSKFNLRIAARIGNSYQSYVDPLISTSAKNDLLEVAMSDDGSVIAVKTKSAVRIATNPVIPFIKELNQPHIDFLEDLARIGTKAIIRLNAEQFATLESMPWPVIQAVLKTYLITWTPNSKEEGMNKVKFAAEEARLSGYKARLQEKKKEWEAEQASQKKAGEQKKVAEESE